MKHDIENLDILFRRNQPERILSRLSDWEGFTTKKDLEGLYDEISQQRPDFSVGEEQHLYEYAMLENTRNYTPDEINLRYRALCEQIRQKGKGFNAEGNRNILLVNFAEKVLDMMNQIPVCRIEHIADWRDAYLLLGQDIFTTSWLAWVDVNKGDPNHAPQQRFVWPAILRSNDNELNYILQKGIAENHFHLKGSTQNFPLTWGCMMNHPERIEELWSDSNFRYQLSPKLSYDFSLERMPYMKLSLYAACIRALLCMKNRGWISGQELIAKFMSFHSSPVLSEVSSQIDVFRFMNTTSFTQPDGSEKCLDYAIDHNWYCVDQTSPVRFLSGERHFLYECFYRDFTNEYFGFEKELFYLYLIIKNNVRGELVQLNNVSGFRNFARYQDRKDLIYDGLPEYETEALRLSVAAPMMENHVVSLEARITPRDTVRAIEKGIFRNDQRIDFALYGDRVTRTLGETFRPFRNSERRHRYFYAIHFIKGTIWEDNYPELSYRIFPRNKKVRDRIKKQALALKEYLRNCSEPRIYGIDACNYEIGCRPETFATEFRYLFECPYKQNVLSQNGNDSRWGLSFHAGEDFLDIADGIRAIDEAILFLNLQRADRLGHALALGIDPEMYYKTKGGCVFLCKQDLLDNLVWLLFRMNNFLIEIPLPSFNRMMIKARRLFAYIYGDALQQLLPDRQEVDIEGYFRLYIDSWFLRGDHPALYETGFYMDTSNPYLPEKYENFMKQRDLTHSGEKDDEDYESLRNNPRINRLLWLYHYDKKVRGRGMEIEKYLVEPGYVDLMKELQKNYQRYIAQRGIQIECNPSSNVLIGAFAEYDKHPLLNFNHEHLNTDQSSPSLFISLNTDDIGVFDTSLEHEYALVFAAIRDARHREGMMDDEPIYRYLDHLRENGMMMAFCK